MPNPVPESSEPSIEARPSGQFEGHRRRSALRAIGWLAILMAVPIIPFLFFGEQMEGTINRWISADYFRDHWWSTSGIVILLLTSDILLPVPSSGVCTLAGRAMGTFWGTFVCWIGLNFSVLIGYLVGRLLGWSFAKRIASLNDIRQAGDQIEAWGLWLLVIMRPLPILAEASILWAGLTAQPLRRWWLPVAMANLGIAMAWAAMGDFASQYGWFSIAFPLSLAIPVALGVWWNAARRRRMAISKPAAD